MHADEAAIRQLVAIWLDASRAGDTDKVLSLMTDDVVFLTPGHPPMRRTAAFAAGQASLQSFGLQARGEDRGGQGLLRLALDVDAAHRQHDAEKRRPAGFLAWQLVAR